MAEVSGKDAFIGLVYMLGLAALWAWLGYLARSPWVGLAGLAGTIAIQVALNRAQEQRYSGVAYLECLGLLWITSAATMAEYSGRWLWTVPWALSGLTLFVIAGISRGKQRWASYGGIVLGLWSVVWG